MYPNNYTDYNNYPYNNTTTYYGENYGGDDRFFLAPFVVGGLAGTALGYGLANNNQLNNGNCCQGGMWYPVYPVPYPYGYSNTSNNFYY